MQTIDTRVLDLTGDEEAADRVDQFCFAVADVLRRILNLSSASAEDTGTKGVSDG